MELLCTASCTVFLINSKCYIMIILLRNEHLIYSLTFLSLILFPTATLLTRGRGGVGVLRRGWGGVCTRVRGHHLLGNRRSKVWVWNTSSALSGFIKGLHRDINHTQPRTCCTHTGTEKNTCTHTLTCVQRHTRIKERLWYTHTSSSLPLLAQCRAGLPNRERLHVISVTQPHTHRDTHHYGMWR